MKYHLLCEIGPDGSTQIFIRELPGCYSRSPSFDKAVAKAPLKIKEFLDWLKGHGDDIGGSDYDVETEVSEVVRGNWPVNLGDSQALFKADLRPLEREEVEILERHEHGESSLSPVLTANDISVMQEQIYLVKVARPVKEYIAHIAAKTRASDEITVGVSPRGAVFLQRAAQAKAAMEERNFITPDDVKAVSLPVLRHRILPRSSEFGSAERCIENILNTVPVPL